MGILFLSSTCNLKLYGRNSIFSLYNFCPSLYWYRKLAALVFGGIYRVKGWPYLPYPKGWNIVMSWLLHKPILVHTVWLVMFVSEMQFGSMFNFMSPEKTN